MNYKIVTTTVKFIRFDSLYDLFNRVTDRLFKSVSRESVTLEKYIKKQYLSGGTGALKVRSGELRRRTFALVPVKINDEIIGRVVIGSGLNYTPLHVGPAGKVTTIVPKKAKALAIPLSSALTSGGSRLSMFRVQSLWDLHPKLFRGSVKHNLRPDILYYKRGSSITPMFLLRRSVRIKTRVWPEQIAASQAPIIQNNILSDMLAVTARYQ